MKRELQRLVVVVTAFLSVLIGVVAISAQAPRGQTPALPQGDGAAAPAAPQRGGRGAVAPGSESGWSTFQQRCALCHLTPTEKAPSGVEIRQMTPERIYASMTTGSMVKQAEAISDDLKKAIAIFMSGRQLYSSPAGDAKNMPNRCADGANANPANSPSWNGWGNDLANTRFQPAQAAGLTSAQVPQLKLKWAFGLPNSMTTSAQPTVWNGRVFVAGDNGYVYSLDAKSGCVHWSYENGSIVRGSITVGPITAQGASGNAIFFGDGRADIFAVDAISGKMIWKTKADPHVVARITAGLKVYNGVVIVPVSSSEEFASGNIEYPCCTSRGSVVALDANTGKQIWKYWVVEGDPKPVAKNPNGVSVYAPGGGGIWNSPTIDTARNAVYFGTGDATTAPSPKTTDAIVAIDLKTGKFLWTFQADENDVFMGACGGAQRSLACPTPMGPDLDIGNAPVLMKLPNGKQVLVAGTKRGHFFALDPDNKGSLLFRVNAATGDPIPANAPPGGRGGGGAPGIVWGGAADAQNAYYGLGGAGLSALNPTTGKPVWNFRAPTGSLGAAPTVIPGVVFEGSSTGALFAVSSTDGKQLWEFNTSQQFETVNKVPAHGGAISVSGASVAGGMVFVSSGYGITSSGSAGNVVLAFGVN